MSQARRSYKHLSLMLQFAADFFMFYYIKECFLIRPGAEYIEMYSNTLQLLSQIDDYSYITITGPVKMY